MSIFINIFIIVIIILVAIMFVCRGEKRWWKRFEKKPYNFSFRWHGKTLWYSRSFAVSSFVFCKNPNGEWCILANQRGKGAADYHHLWNVCVGYIDFNESAEEAAIRETEEETCILCLDPKMLKLHKLISCPSENHQNITARFYLKIDEDGVNTETPSLVPEIEANAVEKDEVEAVAWIPISEIDNYEWAFNHKEAIMEIYNEKIIAE